MPNLSNVLSPVNVVVDASSRSREAVISTLVELASRSGKVLDKAALLSAVLEREALAATGLGDACAVPHAQTDAVSETIMAVARLENPIDFGGPDGVPARLVFLIAGPRNSAGAHLRLLSKLARLLCDPDFRSAALDARDASALYGVIIGGDQPPACA